MKLAIVTPWLPQNSGIADYVYDLVDRLRLAKQLVIDVFTNADFSDSINGIRLFKIESNILPDLEPYDVIVYQMGNNIKYHGYMLTLMQKHPGIVHLHDLVLHHLIVDSCFGDEEKYLNILSTYYPGSSVMQLVKQLFKCQTFVWETPVVLDLPLFEPVLMHATACIVHSEYAKKRIRQRFKFLPIQVIPQLYNNMLPSPEFAYPQGELIWGIFGHITFNKHVELVLQVLSEIAANHPVKLIIAGNYNKKIKRLLQGYQKTLANFTYEYHIDVPLTEFNLLLKRVDVVIALRYPSMGETSAIVSKVLQLGKLCIVSDTCSYAVLPDHIIKIDMEHEVASTLSKAILKLITDIDYRKTLYEQAYNCAVQTVNHDKVINEYIHYLFVVYDIYHGQPSLNQREYYAKLLGGIMGEKLTRLVELDLL